MSNPTSLTEDVLQTLETSVLCWLATVSEDGFPNVSPKEAFLHDGDGKILIAHIASPMTVRNIQQTGKACASFLDVFVQKGYKIECTARIVKEGDEGYVQQHGKLFEMIGDQFPIQAVMELTPTRIHKIIAPSYHLYPNTQERDMIEASLKSYRVDSLQKAIE